MADAKNCNPDSYTGRNVKVKNNFYFIINPNLISNYYLLLIPIR